VEKLVAFSAPIWVAEKKTATWLSANSPTIGGGQTAQLSDGKGPRTCVVLSAWIWVTRAREKLVALSAPI